MVFAKLNVFCTSTMYPNMSTGNCCGRSVTFAHMMAKALVAK
ncbi:MAG: hypothetical protein RSG23_02320 [Gordonibacter sp.]